MTKMFETCHSKFRNVHPGMLCFSFFLYSKLVSNIGIVSRGKTIESTTTTTTTTKGAHLLEMKNYIN